MEKQSPLFQFGFCSSGWGLGREAARNTVSARGLPGEVVFFSSKFRVEAFLIWSPSWGLRSSADTCQLPPTHLSPASSPHAPWAWAWLPAASLAKFTPGKETKPNPW